MYDNVWSTNIWELTLLFTTYPFYSLNQIECLWSYKHDKVIYVFCLPILLSFLLLLMKVYNVTNILSLWFNFNFNCSNYIYGWFSCMLKLINNETIKKFFFKVAIMFLAKCLFAKLIFTFDFLEKISVDLKDENPSWQIPIQNLTIHTV